MRAFAAMLMDSYRQLNSRKLFWVVLSLSGLIVVNFASIGFDENGISMMFGAWRFDNPLLVRGSIFAKIIYRSIFSSFIVGFWLAWIATILALISTTSIFPDFIADGAIDLVLSKPIGRVRLFVLKYVASLLFVLLQVGPFCVGVFFCMGLRLGDWEWRIFAAIPLVVLFFSYLYAVNVLIGVWTRSALAALLATLLFWVSLFGLNFAEFALNRIKLQYVVEVEDQDDSIRDIEANLARVDEQDPDAAPRAAGNLRLQLASLQADRDRNAELLATLDKWHGPTRLGQSLLPKTSDTIALLDRWLRRDTDVDFMDILSGHARLDANGAPVLEVESRDREIQRRMDEELRSKSVWSITGTSLAFELVVLSLACFIFVRRDY